MLQSMIGKIGIFMICAQMILHFRPKEAYGKYLRLLFSVMILIQIVQPFMGLFQGKNEFDLQESMKQFQKSLDESMEQAVEKAASSEERLEQMSLEEVQERMEETEGEETTEESAEESVEIDIAPITPQINSVEEIRIVGEDEDE